MPSHPNIPTSYLEAQPHAGQELLETLVRQPSVAAQNYGIAEMATLMEELLRETGFQTQRLEVPDAPPAIYGELKGRSPFTLLLYNHYDVQPAEPLELWLSPPYEPTIRDGKLYARGSSDNKAEIAARLAAVRALLAEHGELPITLRWIIEGEEEVGSPHFGAIAEKYADLLKADGCLWEGGSFTDSGRPAPCVGTKGLLYVEFNVRGIGLDAHSGNASILPSAAWRLVQALASLRSPDGRVLIPGFYDDVRQPTPAEREALANLEEREELIKHLYDIEQFVDGLTGIELRERASFSPTSNIAGLLSGYTGEGTKTVLPSKAMAKMDFRLVPNQDPHDILAKLKAHLHAQGYDDIEVTVFGAAEPVVTPMDEPFVQRILQIAEEYAEQPASITPIVGGTLPLLGALRKFVGVPGLSAPGNAGYWGSAAHAPNENIRVADLERAVHYNCHMFLRLGDA